MKLFTAISSLLALLVTSKADGLGGLVYAPGHASLNYYTYPSYAFEYAVRDPHTGDNKAQWEKRDGDAVIGAYSLVEPDGTIRVVEYRADDKSGFNAVVKRIGPNLHPVSAPIYKAPIPVLGQKLITPLSIGPVAGLKGLADAPLLSGPVLGGLGGAVSSANLYKARVPVIKDIGPIAEVGHILPAPILKEPLLGLSYGPIIKEPLLPISHGPVLKEPIGSLYPDPIYKGPLSYGPAWKEPIAPVLPAPILKGPLLGHGIKEPLLGPQPYVPILPAPIKGPLLGPLIKEPFLGPLNYGPISIKEPIGLDLGYGGNLDYGLLGKELLNKGGYGLGH